MKKKVVYVIGHKNPDTDSICSAIALAGLKTSGGMDNVVAARAGDLNPQTTFVLDRLGIEPPAFLPDVHPRARDIMSTGVFTVSEDTPVQKAMEIMRRERISFIPVLNGGSRPVGVLTLMALAKLHMAGVEAGGSNEVVTSLKNITETLNGRVVLDYPGGGYKRFSIYVCAMEEASFLNIISGKDPRECVVIVGDRVDIQKRCVERGVGVIIISGGFEACPEVIEEAQKAGVSVVISPLDSATTALFVRSSMPAGRVCDRSFVKASPDEPVEELRYRLAGTRGLVVVDKAGVMRGIVTKSSLLRRSRVSLILVDHNEVSQAVDGADKVDIIEVVDHHRIGGFQTTRAIPFTCEPVGSTSTIVAGLYIAGGAPITKKVAGLLLAGVLSDTVMLKSPTTTERDREVVRWLEERSGLDWMAFGAEIFGSTSSLKKRGAHEAVRADHKVFTTKGRKFGIGQVETIGFDEFYEEKEGLVKELVSVREEMGLDLSALLVTDIVMGTSLLLAVGGKEILYNMGYPEAGEGVYELKDVISRKKQVVPHILSVFNEIY